MPPVFTGSEGDRTAERTLRSSSSLGTSSSRALIRDLKERYSPAVIARSRDGGDPMHSGCTSHPIRSPPQYSQAHQSAIVAIPIPTSTHEEDIRCVDP